MTQKIIQAGHSLVVVIPSRFIKSVGIKKGDTVKVRVNLPQNKITYHFKGAQQLSLTDEIKD